MCMKERHLQSTADVYESEDFRLQTGYRMQTADFLSVYPITVSLWLD